MSEPTDYKETRLEKQIEWHSKKSKQNKLRFRLYQIVILIAGAIIPIINVANVGDFQTRVVSSIIGGMIVVVTGVTQLEKYQENWILYRTSAELLKKEKYFFENNVGEYSKADGPEKNKLLVERVESIVSAETSKYFAIHRPEKVQQQQQQQPQQNEPNQK
jgi:Protein of unknown function (DUF4231)